MDLLGESHMHLYGIVDDNTSGFNLIVRETEGVAPVAPRPGGKDYAIITQLQVSGRGGFSRPPYLISARPWADESAPTTLFYQDRGNTMSYNQSNHLSEVSAF